MRFALIAVCLGLAACAAPQGTSERLTPSDSATQLATGGPLTLTIVSQRPTQEGMDPLVTLTVTTADGRALVFQEANHTNTDLAAQRPGGPLANVMGFFGEEAPTLYQRVEGGSGAPFICAPDGPLYLGVHRADNGEIAIVGLKSAFEFEDAGTSEPSALPYSPDHVCARMKFRAGR